MIVVSKFWTQLLSLGKANAITIFPFIFLKNKALKRNAILIQHERIHIRQAVELLVIFFYIWYLLEFCIHYIRLRDFYRAYRQISFEQEAYAKEAEMDYLKKRKRFSFWAYLKNA